MKEDGIFTVFTSKRRRLAKRETKGRKTEGKVKYNNIRRVIK